MRGSGVRGAQFTRLATLIQTERIATTRLADFQGLERTTLTRNLALLVRDGFVRIDEGEDRRRSQGGDHARRRRGRATRLPVLEESAGRGFGGGELIRTS
jgi:hypothetical protein